MDIQIRRGTDRTTLTSLRNRIWDETMFTAICSQKDKCYLWQKIVWMTSLSPMWQHRLVEILIIRMPASLNDGMSTRGHVVFAKVTRAVSILMPHLLATSHESEECGRRILLLLIVHFDNTDIECGLSNFNRICKRGLEIYNGNPIQW